MLEIRVSDTLAIPSFANRLGDVTLDGALGAATEAEARLGVAADKWITPLRITNALREDGYINPKRFFGAKGDTVLATSVGTDDTTALQDAIEESMEAIATGEPERAEIRLPSGNYRTTGALDLNQFSMKMRGNGRSGSRIIVDHDLIGVRFYRSSWVLENIGIHASLDRAALAYDPDRIGVLLQGPAGDTDNFGGQINNVLCQGHPGHGAVLIGAGIECRLFEARLNKGHGLVIDAGRIRGLSGGDLIPQGFSTEIFSPRAVNNGGHSVVIGHPDDTSAAYVLRTDLYNLDSGPNATDAAVRYTPDDGFVHGEGINIQTCANQGGDGGAGGGWTLAGKDINLHPQRSVAGAAYTANIKAYAGILSANINVHIGRVIGGAQDPAVIIDAGVPDYTVNVYSPDTSNVTNAATAGKAAHLRHGVQHEFRGGRSGFDSIYGTNLGPVGDDQVLKVQLNASITGMFAIWASTSTGRAALVFAGVGASPFCTLMALSFNVTVGTGAQVAGAGTGVDGDLNITTHTDDCFYFKNRTGSSRTLHMLPLTQINARVTGVTLLA